MNEAGLRFYLLDPCVYVSAWQRGHGFESRRVLGIFLFSPLSYQRCVINQVPIFEQPSLQWAYWYKRTWQGSNPPLLNQKATAAPPGFLTIIVLKIETVIHMLVLVSVSVHQATNWLLSLFHHCSTDPDASALFVLSKRQTVLNQNGRHLALTTLPRLVDLCAERFATSSGIPTLVGPCTQPGPVG